LTHLLNIAGLVVGIIGVAIIFRFGPPQPNLETGVSIGLLPGTPFGKDGRTVADHNCEVERTRRLHSRMSKVGLALVIVGFALQLCSEVIQLLCEHS
jgi:hypothetical protein